MFYVRCMVPKGQRHWAVDIVRQLSETISTRRFSFFEPCVIFIKIFNEKKMYWHLHYVSGLSEILICLPHFSISIKKKNGH